MLPLWAQIAICLFVVAILLWIREPPKDWGGPG